MLMFYWKKYFLLLKSKKTHLLKLSQQTVLLNQGNKAFKFEYTYIWDGISYFNDIL
jgi:hypothetical protein